MLLEKIFDFFASLKLSVIVLSLALVLVFFGTLAQEPMGLYLTQERFFKSFFVDFASMSAAAKKMLQMFGVYLTPSTAVDVLSAPRIPVFPGGYGLGFLLLTNLLASQIKTFEWSWKRLGLQAVHLGLILLLVSQFATDIFAVESSMHLREGELTNYSELDRYAELAVVEVSKSGSDRVTSISQDRLAEEGEISLESLPFTIRVEQFYANSTVTERPADSATAPSATQGIGPRVTVVGQPRVTRMNQRDMPSVFVEFVAAEGSRSLGTWVASFWIGQEQTLQVGDREFRFSLRPKRLYKPYSIELLDFRHEQYPGTQIPKDFSSMVRVTKPSTGEQRDVRIYMNNPLRYGGETYYQSGFDPDDQGTVLQVVRNPGRLAPYLGCVIISLGLLAQFMLHLIEFFTRRRFA